MSEAPHDPPLDGDRRAFRFKPREFTAINPPASTPSETPIDVRDHVAATSAKPPPSAAASSRAPDDEIQTMLRANVARACAAGLNDVKPAPRRRSRRLRDYIIVTLLVNAGIAAVARAFRENPIVLVFTLAACVLFNAKFAWSVWMVMDDY